MKISPSFRMISFRSGPLLATGVGLLCCSLLVSAGVVLRKERGNGEETLPDVHEHRRHGQKERLHDVKPGPLKIFILAGQSNMEGQAAVDTINASDPNHGYSNGTLKYLIKDPRTEAEFAVTVNASTGNWTVRDDVWVWFNENGRTQDGTYGPLSVGYGSLGDPHKFGPEYAFGFVMGDAIQEQVLIIKTAWGGKNLSVDFRPPSSGGNVGPYYEMMLQDVQSVLGNLSKLFPAYDTKSGYDICGFGWFQGWNDGLVASMVAEYEKNMVNLIKDVRAAWKVPSMPVSIPVAGFSGWALNVQRRLDLIQAQFNAANETLHPEINNATHPIVAAEETRGFWRDPKYSPADRVYHYNLNAETYWWVGKVMGQAMVKMLSSV